MVDKRSFEQSTDDWVAQKSTQRDPIQALNERDARIGMDPSKAITAYWLCRHDCPGRMFAGITPEEVAETLRVELTDDRDSELPPDELSTFGIEAYETTQAEIDALPDFGGW